MKYVHEKAAKPYLCDRCDKSFRSNKGGFQFLDLIITELKSHMTCYNPIPFIGWNHSIQTGEQIHSVLGQK